MKAERTYFDYLEDILDAMQKIRGFIQGMDYEQFCQDSKTAFAVVHGLKIIGEASKRVPDFVKGDHPEIPWRTMAGMRDKLIHNYFGTHLADHLGRSPGYRSAHKKDHRGFGESWMKTLQCTVAARYRAC